MTAAVYLKLLSTRRTMSASIRWFLLCCVVALCIGPVKPLTDLEFERSPATVISSLGKPVMMQCTLKGTGGEEEDPPDVLWLHGGEPLQIADTTQSQVHTGSDTWTIRSTLRIEKVQLTDMGSYQCAVFIETEQAFSDEGSIQLEGLPHFSVEPQPMSIVANVSLILLCVAHGPPEPVRVIWLQDGVPLNALTDPVALSPSTLNITGLNRTSSFSCEAHNRKGVATSGSGVITVLPSQPSDLRAVEITQDSLRVTWQPGFGGDYPIIHCSVQAKHVTFTAGPDQMIHNQNVNISPATHLIGELEPHSLYAVRVSCHSSQGPSEWSPWVEMRTKEGGPTISPPMIPAQIITPPPPRCLLRRVGVCCPWSTQPLSHPSGPSK